MRDLVWIGSSKRDLIDMPEDIKDVFGYALHLAQDGQRHSKAKPLSGWGSAGTLEVVESFDGDAYRAVYTATFPDAIYVLHCFVKKSKSGIATPQQDLDLIAKRYKHAAELAKGVLK